MNRWALAVALGAAAAAVALACGTGAIGVGACKQIEQARCNQLPNCPKIPSPDTPYGSPVDECIRYYDIDCLHGLSVATNPSSSEVSECVAAINEMPTNCAVLATPQLADACAWLVPPADVDAGDAAAEAAAEASVDAGESD
jgi:hypothetical protein